ncbi:MAG TPA: WhiB family transcriptional regulator [Candidatus Limnocylindrales bacterium]|nr:WhiB family transcriptional regulator [Candidatus Limnocylindrales bacterium]
MSVAAPYESLQVPDLAVVGEPEVPTVMEDIRASIARTAFTTEGDRIPPLSSAVLDLGNTAVQKTFGDSARRLLVVGPDAVRFSGNAADILEGPHVPELLGLLVIKRRLATPDEYLEMNFLKGGEYEERRAALSAARTIIDELMAGDGTDLLHKKGERFGIDGFIVADARNDTRYQQARTEHAQPLWLAHIMAGTAQPEIVEQVELTTAWGVRGTIDVQSLDDEQFERWLTLGERIEELAKTPGHHLKFPVRPVAPSARAPKSPQTTISDQGMEVRRRFVEEFEPEWHTRAACKGPQGAVFYAASHERKDEREARENRAKEICALCPVRRACLEYALEIKEPDGIWGGLTEKERKQLMVRN